MLSSNQKETKGVHISSQRGKEKSYQMKSNTNIIIKPDQAARLDILINHQLFKPRYRRVNHKDY